MKRRRLWQYLFDWGLIGLICVIGTLINYRYEIRGSHFVAPQSLQTTSGTIVDANVTQFTSSSYTPNVTYAYTVKGTEYTTSNYSFTHLTFRESAEAHSFLATYPVGKTVTVHYASNDPGFATLLPASQDDFSWLTWGGGLAGLCMVVGWSNRPARARRPRIRRKSGSRAAA